METTVLGLRVLLALACVIGLIWVLARRAGWGKGRRRPAGPAVEVVGRQALGRHAGVAVIAVGERRLLLGYGEQNVTMLTELEPGAAEEEAPEEPATTRTPMTLGDLAAAVLPSQRRRARAAAPVTVSATSFEDALAAATVAGDPAVPAATTATTSVTPVPVPVVDAAAAAASATAAARAAALAAAAAVPAVPAVRPADLPEPAAAGALHGSVLAPSTWKQAVAALRERTVRR